MNSLFRPIGALLLCGVASAVHAANPATMTVTPGQSYTYTSGPFSASNPTATNELVCNAATPCDDHTVTVVLPNDGKQYRLKVSTGWASPAEDYDIYMYKGTSLVNDSAGSANPEGYNQDVQSCDYILRVVPFAVAPGSTATTTVILEETPGGSPTSSNVCGATSGGGGSSGGGVSHTVPNPVGPSVPRYAVHAPSNALSGDTGEPSIGYNPHTKTTFVVSGLKFLFQKRPEDLTPAQPESCDGEWVDRSHPFTSVTTLDPIGLGDSIVRGARTGSRAGVTRMWGGQLTGKTHNTVYTEDDGLNWMITEGNAPVATGFDHQGIASGPYPTTGLGASYPHPLYPNAFYYCGQDIAYANCTRSDDGGLTFQPPQQMYQLTTCGGLHGHPRVGPDGTVGVPNPNCGGNTAVVISTDAGTTWSVRKIPDSPGSGYDPQASFGTTNQLGVCHTDGTGKPLFSRSDDKGLTWPVKNVILGAEHGIEHVAFTQGLAGTPGRFVCAYLGTRTKGNPTAEDFPGVWHVYFSTTLDGGLTWTTVNATPTDPVQGFGGVWDGGGGNINRNLLDFNEMAIDENGYPMLGYADGCVGACDLDPTTNTYSAHPRIARQVGGPSLWADKDPANLQYVPKRSCLAGTRDAQASYLSWRVPDNGGNEIVGYDIYRSTASGQEVKIASTGTKPEFRDLTADPNEPVYFYTVTAKNRLGDGLFSNEVELPLAQLPVESLCVLPGLTVNTDPSGDQSASAAAGALNDILTLSAAEPKDEDGKLLLTLRLRGGGTLVEGDMYATRFLLPGDTASNHHWVAMIVQGGVPTFHYGTVEVGSVVLVGTTVYTRLGALPAGSSYSPSGSIQFVVPHSLFSLNRGDQLTGFDVVVFPGASGTGPYTHRSQSIHDRMEGGVYRLRDATFCNPNTAPVPVLTPSTLRGPGPLRVTFDLTGSFDAEDAIVEYQFFESVSAQPVVQSTSAPIVVTYTQPGRYTARLKVKDARGLASESVAQVIIEVLEDTVEQGVAAFEFIVRENVKTNTFITSELITMSGFTGTQPISVSEGMQYSINNGPFTNQPGTVAAGQKIAVRHVSSNLESTRKEGVVTVGTFSTKFVTITTTLDHVPAPFGYATQNNVTAGAVVMSEPFTLQEYDDAPVQLGGAATAYSINNGPWQTASGKIVCNGPSKTACTSTIRIRHKANTSSLGYTKSYVQVGGVRGHFTTRTKK
jgi:hypothetical protein